MSRVIKRVEEMVEGLLVWGLIEMGLPDSRVVKFYYTKNFLKNQKSPPSTKTLGKIV